MRTRLKQIWKNNRKQRSGGAYFRGCCAFGRGCRKRKTTLKKTVSRKVFPGYVLIKMVMTDDTWYVIRNTTGVTGFVGPGSKPVPLSEEEVEALGVDKKRNHH
ncbi:MAG: hypothetical protein L6V93_16290 [Clostridiales bacterium]|nr:MAG: hypothetical protein L6V93_16290 [Clostridiales bacterium]